MRRYLAAGIWLVMTIVATFIVWEAVSVVAADVTDRPPEVVAHHEVVTALQAGSAQPPPTTTTTVPTSSTTAPRVTPTTTTLHPPATTPTTVGSPGGPTFIPVTTTTRPPSPPTTKPTGHPVVPSTLAPPVGGTATYSNDGGIVGVGCTSFDTIRLIAALPNDGYQALVSSSSGLFVQVNFIGQGRNIPVGAACVFGQPFPLKENNP